VGGAVGGAVDDAVYGAVRDAVDDAVYGAVYGAIVTKLTWHYWLGGALWSYWPAYTQFFFEVCGLDLGEINRKARAYAELSRSAGYCWPNRAFIMVCDRPKTINRDKRGRLHSEDGHAISWRDGWGIFMWHGVRVPAKLIMEPNAATKEEILGETNSEVSRAWAERLGWERYFALADVVKIDDFKDAKTGLAYELYDFRKRAGERQPRLLKMQSPTLNDGGQPYYIEPVDPGLKTAQAARRWQFQKPNGNFPEVDECNKEPSLEFGWEA